MGSNGTGLSTSITDGVIAVLNSVEFDVYAQAYDDPSDSVDAVDHFILKVEPDPSGGTDPLTGGVCLEFPAADLVDNFTGPKASPGADGIKETIRQVHQGPLYCFKVTAKPQRRCPCHYDRADLSCLAEGACD